MIKRLVCAILKQAVDDLDHLRELGAIRGTRPVARWFSETSGKGGRVRKWECYRSARDVKALLYVLKSPLFSKMLDLVMADRKDEGIADSSLILKALGLAGTEAERNRAIKLRQGLRKTNSLSRDLIANRPEPEVGLESETEEQGD